MMIPFPHQVEGAKFLAERPFAILADQPRVGKTGTAIMATDAVGAVNVLVVTTASGRGVWKRGFDDWSIFGRPLQVLTPKDKLRADTRVAVVGWPSVGDYSLRTQLLARQWDVLILDEAHYGKSFEAKRTQAVFGTIGFNGRILKDFALSAKASLVWSLTGTPMPNSPFDLYPVLVSCAFDVLRADHDKGWPDVTLEASFKKRYCKVKPKKIGHGWAARWIDVIVGGQNLDELRQRCEGLILLRTQQDVGIRAPIYETMPLIVSEAQRRKIEAAAGDAREILRAVESGETKDLEMHLGPLRRLTGAIKAEAVVQAVKDEFESGLDRIVLAYWHKEVAEKLIAGLHEFGVVGIDGSTPPAAREANVAAFQRGDARVFLGQIAAAGEAIDLSAACELIFVEMSFIPKDGKQMSLRITNHGQARQARVRVATLDGSIDDAIGASLLRKWTSINEVLHQGEPTK
jgi:hypothetical protein